MPKKVGGEPLSSTETTSRISLGALEGAAVAFGGGGVDVVLLLWGASVGDLDNVKAGGNECCSTTIGPRLGDCDGAIGCKDWGCCGCNDGDDVVCNVGIVGAGAIVAAVGDVMVGPGLFVVGDDVVMVGPGLLMVGDGVVMVGSGLLVVGIGVPAIGPGLVVVGIGVGLVVMGWGVIGESVVGVLVGAVVVGWWVGICVTGAVVGDWVGSEKPSTRNVMV
mmetsp:Transcript_7896/g.13627  ORF Transcript_7896/g.13627 Transcript_7896/m.13627 type:complete len:220 (+) Transcript_7896:244-903(+)